jgi:hypothetical protein
MGGAFAFARWQKLNALGQGARPQIYSRKKAQAWIDFVLCRFWKLPGVRTPHLGVADTLALPRTALGQGGVLHFKGSADQIDRCELSHPKDAPHPQKGPGTNRVSPLDLGTTRVGAGRWQESVISVIRRSEMEQGKHS